MSRAVIYEKFGGPEVLELRDVAEPHAGPGQIRIRVTAVGLNPMDPAIAATPDLAARFDITLPSGFGYDFAGSRRRNWRGRHRIYVGRPRVRRSDGASCSGFRRDGDRPVGCHFSHSRRTQRRGREHAARRRRNRLSRAGGTQPLGNGHGSGRRGSGRRGHFRRPVGSARWRNGDRDRVGGHASRSCATSGPNRSAMAPAWRIASGRALLTASPQRSTSSAPRRLRPLWLSASHPTASSRSPPAPTLPAAHAPFSGARPRPTQYLRSPPQSSPSR